MPKLIFGCGYLGRRVADRWSSRGETVYAVTRNSERADIFANVGYSPIVANVTDPASLSGLPPADTILYAVGFDRTSGKSMQEIYFDGLRNVLDRLPPEADRFIYISSTGVYGDAGDDWVDESTPCEPTREGGRICLEAEQLLQKHAVWGPRAIILRMAGIYGPGRVPYREAIVQGDPLQVNAEGYLNLIHVRDAADIVLAVDEKVSPPALYVVSDGQPVIRRDYYAEIARLLDRPLPPITEPDPDSPKGSRSAASKRIKSDKLMREVNPQLNYPSYREGLAAIVAEESQSSD